ncbi:uncharacterized protein RCO7_00530 [Rhynchosporium graminicola]|uniref:Uncharacterized protein n=1 Tax=Rhynchosporium graminicola TaxID=2792576 RepID=A0A1E1KMF1_9HELO|nr:uncharacterized protein RCO7_00530 [Rhynchosporium commune]
MDYNIRPHVSMTMVQIFRDKLSFIDAFAFKSSASTSLRFAFDRPVLVPASSNRLLKRRRALSDVDGEGNKGWKKRRLRLFLITSRLSRPFSQPASNIVNHGMNKFPIWGAKNKALNKPSLRKVAITNRVRRRIDAARDFMRMEQEKIRERLSLREIFVPKAHCHDLPLPPSPLGVSNYDALDLEDEDVEREDSEEWNNGGGLDRISTIYSDFNIMMPMTDDHGDDALDDHLDALHGISRQDRPATPATAPQEECIIGILREDCQGEGLFVHIRE